MPLGQQGQIRPTDQIVLLISPRLDLAVDVRKPLLGVQRVNDIVRILEEILQILLRGFDLARPLGNFRFERLIVLLEMLLQTFAFGDVVQLDHDGRSCAVHDADD
ncbi:MAG TPA: hypothetical protein VE968_08260, partial [Sphingomicrobium sp.]|nr:hypothetical protein [Sphingomicrobium sp.]